MFKRIYYDSYKNKLYLWETVNGKTSKLQISPKFEYYIKDQSNQSPIKDIYGTPVVKRISESKEGVKSLIDSGIDCYESDIPMDIMFLQKRYGDKDLTPNMKDIVVGIIDIECASGNEMPKTSKGDYPINLISLWLSSTNEVYTFGLKEYTGNSDLVKNYHYCEDEKVMIERFIEFFLKSTVDILSGWYSNLFDVPYFCKRCDVLGIEKNLSPIGQIIKRKDREEYTIAGLNLLDYIELYKNFTYETQESYSLNSVAMHEVGEGKLEFEGTINNIWKTDWNRFVEYNVQDVLLVKKIDDKLRFIELVVNICYQCLIPFEKVYSSVAIHTGYILKFLHRMNMVMPPMKIKEEEEFPGAYVISEPGFHKYIMTYDVESLYPTIIRMLNIGPESLRINPTNTENLIKTPLSESKGLYYTKEQSVLPKIVEKIFGERKVFKKKMFVSKMFEQNKSDEEICSAFNLKQNELVELKNEIEKENGNSTYYKSQQQIRKILINSLYGVLANRFFHFYNINNAMMITLTGQDIIKYLSESVNNYFKHYFYKNKKYFGVFDEKNRIKSDVTVLVDTDSCIICLDEVVKKLGLKFKDNSEFLKWAKNFDKEFFEPFFEKLLTLYTDRYKVPQIINFKREKIATKILVTAKKRYILEVLDEEGITFEEPKFITKGLEIVRTDTPSFCRKRILEAVKEIFRTEDREEVISFMKKIRKDFDKAPIGEISIPKGVSDYKKYSKSFSEYMRNGLSYEKGCPIHNRASINYNYLVEKYKLNLQKIDDGTKMKFVYVHPQNEIHTDVIGFIGNWPNEFNKIFKIDYNLQWEKSFQNIFQRFFDIMGWGEISFNDSLKKFFC